MITSRNYGDLNVNGRRAGEQTPKPVRRALFCQPVDTRETDIPLRVKKDQAEYFLSLPAYSKIDTFILLQAARPVFVTDRASAIAALVTRRVK